MVGQMLSLRNEEIRPPWLKPLLETSFFVHCKIHGDSSKSECNMYCLDCTCGALCSYCLGRHRDHRVIQIRRSSYHDVIRVSEIQKVLDITGVQTYIINSARVVFLNERPQPRPGKGVTNTCQICERSLLDTFRFCSLGCKLTGTQCNRDMTPSLQRKQQRKDSEAKKTFQHITHKNADNTAIEDYDTSNSVISEEVAKFGYSPSRNFNQDMSPPTPPPTTVNYRTTKRRKGIPHRAPLGS
eukprot:Gb_33451 [translate_table: standard]